jgi:hypothetical protein
MPRFSHELAAASTTLRGRRTAPSMVRSGSRMSPKTTVISVPQASPSIMVAGVIGTVPIPTSGPASVVVRARKGHTAPVPPSGVLSSTSMNRPGNAPGTWRTRQSSPMPSGKERRWKPFRGTEADRAASLALAQTEVRAGAVLPGGRGPEHQTTRAVPQPTDKASPTSHHVAPTEVDPQMK